MADRESLEAASPDEIAATLPPPDSITSVIEHQVKPGADGAYKAWLGKIGPIAARFPGYQGINIVAPQPGSHTYTLALRFDTLDHAETWFHSRARRELIAEVEPCLAGGEHIEMKTGLEFWFTPGAQQQRISPHKQALVTFSAIYPLTLIVPAALHPLYDLVPILQYRILGNVLVAAIIVSLMTYVIMPRYTRLISSWLHS